jgi:hypothetical protein
MSADQEPGDSVVAAIEAARRSIIRWCVAAAVLAPLLAHLIERL